MSELLDFIQMLVWTFGRQTLSNKKESATLLVILSVDGLKVSVTYQRSGSFQAVTKPAGLELIYTIYLRLA